MSGFQIHPARFRRLHRAVRRMVRVLAWQAGWVVMLAALTGEARLTRWLARRIDELEHGLRCLVVIAATAMRPAERRRHERLAKQAPTRREPGESCEHAPRDGRARRLGQLNLSMRVFRGDEADTQASGQTPPSPAARALPGVLRLANGGRHREGRTKAHPLRQTHTRLSHLARLHARVRRLQALVGDPQGLVPRLLRQAKRDGFGLAVWLVLRPETVWRAPPAPAPFPGFAPAPAICDSS